MILQRVFEILDSLFVAAELKKDDAALKKSAVVIGRRLERFGELADRKLFFPRVEARETFENVAFDRARFHRDQVVRDT